MNFDPAKFFIGLMDFFTVLLPGGILVYVAKDALGLHGFGASFRDFSTVEGWMVFLVASYFVGHFAFLIGAMLDLLYEVFRRRTLNAQIARMARDGVLSWRPLRVIVWLLFKEERDRALLRAIELKRQSLRRVGAEDSMNAFQWCKAYLSIAVPESLATVRRFEADSKFFRSSVVLCLAFAVMASCPKWRPGFVTNLSIAYAALAALALLALWRYMDQRHKSTNQAYWSVIALIANGAKAPSDTNRRAGEPTHAGGVVLKFDDPKGRPNVLLVRTKNHPQRWVLPKGHIEDFETDRETAVREVLEEARIWARISDDLNNGASLETPSYRVAPWAEEIKVRYYLMEYVEGLWMRPQDRETEWLPMSQAINQVAHGEAKDILEKAEEIVSKRTRSSDRARSGSSA